MKTFKVACAQGDVYFFKRLDKLPPNAVKVEPVDGKIVIAHSETGHHHVMDAKTTTMYKLPDSITACLLVVNKPTALEHLRPFDTHEPIMFDAAIHYGVRQREHTHAGWRLSAD